MPLADAWPSILRCVQIADGEAHMIVCAVGVNCQWGLILTALEPEDDETPLQQDLGDLATSTSSPPTAFLFTCPSGNTRGSGFFFNSKLI
jgi:hypothetical protein